MIKDDFYYSYIAYYLLPHQRFILANYDKLSDGGKFHINVCRLLGNNMLQPRMGEWSLPWNVKVMPGYEMPKYDPNFKKTFSDVTDEFAQQIKYLINTKGLQFMVFYSGGIDSTVCLTALLKNLSARELANIHVNLSMDSIIENPTFFKNHIEKKFANRIHNSDIVDYSKAIHTGYVPITLDQGDTLFGTELGTGMYAKYNELINYISEGSRKQLIDLHDKVISLDTHYSKYEELIIAYFSIPKSGEYKFNPDFGKKFYRKVVKNIETSNVPIHTLHDFFWWTIFNIKYMFCAFRAPLHYGDEKDIEYSLKGGIVNWFGTEDYQKWSMANNNNGEKISGPSHLQYKWAARKYIYEFDKDDWYFNYKMKIGSLRNIFVRNYAKMESNFALGTDFKLIPIETPEAHEFLLEKLQNYKLDWL